MAETELNYPSELPVCEHRQEILSALRQSPVVIVCGDTGSGKTTQLPKMALELGRAARGRRIACTQPRRLAAVTMAERVAAELKTEIGGLVGYRHRFGRKISSETRIEFMTDGVLLAETRFDPLLRAYDTIIVDEAHERSLNVDFLLGILKRILARRSDLKVVISSATLDSARFSEFFDDAPAIEVPGRLFPIEIGYRPPPDGEERDLPRDVAEAVAELPPRDDILVFLPGERDIRETAEFLTEARGGFDDIIPLLASLPAAEQRRAFCTSPRRRIILATNVAETSVTIPGIRAVIDSGLARISRYVHRTQVQRLQIEPISQASARQRTGRCGRLGPGTCLRLYSEEDFAARDAYTPPEVLRSSLAGVILTMLDLQLGDIEKFPFIDPPKPTMVREGLRELLELGAIRRAKAGGPELTDIGRKLAKIPVEPRLARMLVAGARNAVLPSVLPLVAAMACDDPRRRPIDERAKADQAHAKFREQGSDFLGTLKLWRWWEDETKNLSQSKARKLCKANYLSYPKMREWRDLARQLESLCKRLGLSLASNISDPATLSILIHRSLLAGLLGRIGRYDEEERNYRGAYGLRFAIHPGSVLAKPPKRRQTPQAPHVFPSWIVAGELVDTSQLFAREAAVIDVRWLEPVAGSVCKHSYHSPEWDERSGFVRATEQVTLHGLVIVPARRCDYSRIDPVVSREIFIRRGIIDGAFPRPPPPVRANQQLLDALRKRAERTRHPEYFDEGRLYAHFQKTIPEGICSADALRKWLRLATPEESAAFVLKKADWWPSEAAANGDFPDCLRIAGAKLSLTYRHTPDDPESDGVTCTVRQSDVGVLKLWRADWLVPGLLPEKVAWMLGTLPSALRRVLAPLDEATAILLSLLKPGEEPLEDAIRKAVKDRWGFSIPETAWQNAQMPLHLQMRFRVRDDATGKTLAVSRDLSDIFSQTSQSWSKELELEKGGFPSQTSRTSRTWTFGTIPLTSTDRNAGWATTSYPALHDEGDGVALRLYPDAEAAAESHAAGVARLFELNIQIRNNGHLARCTHLPHWDNGHLARCTSQPFQSILSGAIRETYVRNRPEVRNAEEFDRRLNEDRSALIKNQTEIEAIVRASEESAAQINRLLLDSRLPEETVDSVLEQLAWLTYPGFPKHVPLETLRHYRRYLKGAMIRIERAKLAPAADLAREEKFASYWLQYREAIKPENAALCHPPALRHYRWMLEEYRVSLFAQELHTPEPISPKRLDAQWERVWK